MIDLIIIGSAVIFLCGYATCSIINGGFGDT